MEVSCTCKNGLLAFAELMDIVVDPYTLEGTPLAEWTRRAITGSNLKEPIKIRKTKILPDIYDEMASLVRQRTPTLEEFPNLAAHNTLIRWAERIRTGGLEYQFTRFADYLRNGTLEPLAELTRNVPQDEYEIMPHYFDDPYEEERARLVQEAYQDAEDWNRSSEEGWYYAD